MNLGSGLGNCAGIRLGSDREQGCGGRVSWASVMGMRVVWGRMGTRVPMNVPYPSTGGHARSQSYLAARVFKFSELLYFRT